MSNILDQAGMGEAVLSGKEAWAYSEDILLKVSRTFALNINVLKGKLHKSILLAYLYLRIADTVEDDPDMNASEKEVLLDKFAEIFRTAELKDEAVEAFESALPEHWRTRSAEPYFDLCLHTHVVVPLLKELPEVYAAPVRDVTIEMCGGMAKFAKRQEAALSSGWFTLESVGDLDEYCYYVAGIVGKLLTHLFAADTCLIGEARKKEMQKLDVSFGLALQVANIVKDCREDSERRVCFVPEEICRRHGFNHSYEMFVDEVAGEAVPEAAAAFEKRRAAVMGELVQKAWKHLDDAIAYTKLIPSIKMRTRLFCLWPLFMAAENMKLIGDGSAIFASDKKVKISRDTVKQIVKSTMKHFYSDKWIDRKFTEVKTSTSI
ncbi:MAG: squalene/phytoene synthase family protein [Fibrobacter sp.]|nr:squalene/phytoene synthase family protein [Fibrobacter sp.]